MFTNPFAPTETHVPVFPASPAVAAAPPITLPRRRSSVNSTVEYQFPPNQPSAVKQLCPKCHALLQKRGGGASSAASSSSGHETVVSYARRGSQPLVGIPLQPSLNPSSSTTILAHSPFCPNHLVASSPHLSNEYARRRSVDVGVLGHGTHAKMARTTLRDAIGPDARDKEAGLYSTSGKERANIPLGLNLASMLSHSLSLCDNSDDEGATDPELPLRSDASEDGASDYSAPYTRRESLSARKDAPGYGPRDRALSTHKDIFAPGSPFASGSPFTSGSPFSAKTATSPGTPLAHRDSVREAARDATPRSPADTRGYVPEPASRASFSSPFTPSFSFAAPAQSTYAAPKALGPRASYAAPTTFAFPSHDISPSEPYDPLYTPHDTTLVDPLYAIDPSQPLRRRSETVSDENRPPQTSAEQGSGPASTQPAEHATKSVDEQASKPLTESPQLPNSASPTRQPNSGSPPRLPKSFSPPRPSVGGRKHSRKSSVVFPSVEEARRFQLVGLLQSWAFNALDYDADEQLYCVGLIFEALNRMAGVSFDLRPLLLGLRKAYHPRNGYHNFTHAVDVTQCCYSFCVTLGLAPPLYVLCEPHSKVWTRPPAVARSRLGAIMRPMDIFALLVAAIGHDVGHPGLSNAYMVNAKTTVAHVFEGKSVLENFHLVTLVHMLRRFDLGGLLADEVNPKKHSVFRQILEASILATDMSQHFDYVNHLVDLGRRFRGAEVDDEHDRLLICAGLMKCSDISNPARPHCISEAWSAALLREWRTQVELERSCQLPVSVMEIKPGDTKAQAKSQLGFIDLFAMPLFSALSDVFSELLPYVDNLREGRYVWEKLYID